MSTAILQCNIDIFRLIFFRLTPFTSSQLAITCTTIFEYFSDITSTCHEEINDMYDIYMRRCLHYKKNISEQFECDSFNCVHCIELIYTENRRDVDMVESILDGQKMGYEYL